MDIRKTIKVGGFISLILFVGCAHVPFFGQSTLSSTVTESDSHRKQTLKSGHFEGKRRIVDAQRLQQGQNLAIIPFKAGVGVEANEELDRVALMIVKGISDVFTDNRGGKDDYFNILTAENSQKADLIIRGHITAIRRLSRVSRWALMKKEKSLDVDGKMTDARTGETVLIFADRAKTKKKTEDYKQLGYRIGKKIGRFILSGAE